MTNNEQMIAMYWHNMYCESQKNLRYLMVQYNELLEKTNKSVESETTQPILETVTKSKEFYQFLNALINYIENEADESIGEIIKTKGVISTQLYEFFLEFCRKYNITTKISTHCIFGINFRRMFNVYKNSGYKKVKNGRKCYVLNLDVIKMLLTENKLYSKTYIISKIDTESFI